VIDQDDADLAPVVGVDRPRRVHETDPVLQREAAARAHLRLEALRQRDGDARRDKGAAPRGEDQIVLDGGKEVHARRAVRHVARKRKVLRSPQSRDGDADLFHGFRLSVRPACPAESPAPFTERGPFPHRLLKKGGREGFRALRPVAC